MGADPFTIFLGVTLGFLQMQMQKKAIAAQAKFANEQSQLEIDEFNRQQDEADLIAAEKKSDRVRQADKEIASITASLSEVGALGTVNELRAVGEQGFLEGLDIARIEGNRRREVASLQAAKRASATGARSSAAVGKIKSKAAGIRFLGSGLNIVADAQFKQKQLDILKDKVNA